MPDTTQRNEKTTEVVTNSAASAKSEMICKAGRYQRNDSRQAQRNGKYERKLVTQAGEVKLQVPKLRGASFVEICLSNIVNIVVLGKTDIDVVIEIGGKRIFCQVKNSNKAWKKNPLDGDGHSYISWVRKAVGRQFGKITKDDLLKCRICMPEGSVSGVEALPKKLLHKVGKLIDTTGADDFDELVDLGIGFIEDNSLLYLF
ncbi:transposase [Rubritalea spongiae]|uniref:Transposase n=1 Tax=Rubritalea spongiae TaxID=430797 RepID=A0ABW5E347_9BACT